MNDPSKKIIVICGPTASGKTGAAIRTALKLNGEVISADSVQVYKYLDIGSAKPTREELETVKHHMIDVVEPNIRFSGGMYRDMASKAVLQVETAGKIPIVAGGTGLYIRALIEGLFEGPGADPELRAGLERAEDENPGYLLAELTAVDPETAARLHHNDRVRLIRALEVYKLTGEPISLHHKRHRESGVFRSAFTVVLDPGKEELERKIEKRAKMMLDTGFIEEVRDLFQRGFSPDMHSLQSVGYKQVCDYLTGKLSYEDLPEAIIRSHIKYVKRQRTWFRKEGIHVRTFEEFPFEELERWLDS